MKDFLIKIVKNQMLDNRNAKPSYKWDSAKKCFFINSEAGLIKYRPKDNEDLTSFRDKFLNPVHVLASRKKSGLDISQEIFSLYRRIKKEYWVSYKANLRTRALGMRKRVF